MTPSATTIRFFSRRMISADSFAISVPVSTDIPMSDSARARESLIPSPKNPMIWFFLLRPVEDLMSAQLIFIFVSFII
jgi:hypothetical protein